MHCQNFLAKLPTAELTRRFQWKYLQIERNSMERSEALTLALTGSSCTTRRARLVNNARAASIAANAARFMLSELQIALANLRDEKSLRAWLITRIGSFDWRRAYALAQ